MMLNSKMQETTNSMPLHIQLNQKWSHGTRTTKKCSISSGNHLQYKKVCKMA